MWLSIAAPKIFPCVCTRCWQSCRCQNTPQQCDGGIIPTDLSENEPVGIGLEVFRSGAAKRMDEVLEAAVQRVDVLTVERLVTHAFAAPRGNALMARFAFAGELRVGVRF